MIALGDQWKTPSLKTFARKWQQGRCYICARKMKWDGGTKAKCATRDHVVPKSAGGKDQENIAFACLRCNREQASRKPTACEIMFAKLLWESHHLTEAFYWSINNAVRGQCRVEGLLGIID